MNEILDITFSVRELLIPCGVIIAVFVVLIWKLLNKTNQAIEVTHEEMPAIQENTLNQFEDYELVAAITAAIACSLGTDSNGLVVKSIKRIPKTR